MAEQTIRLTFRRPDGATVDATIGPDGTATLTVHGAPGLTCRALTAGLEAALGDVRARRMDPRALAAGAAGELAETEAGELDRQIRQAGSGGGYCG